MVLSKLYMMIVQCPQSKCASQNVEFIRQEKPFEYFKCMVCNFRFAVWEIIGLPVKKQ